MSGHSKWAKIKHKKGAADAKRGSSFTKLCKAVTVAAKTGGGDIDFNFSLRLAVERAKAANVPKDNIEKAIKSGTGELKDGAVIEQAVYEGFGPGGTALMIECATDNKNRTVTDVKIILGKSGGSMAGQGSVQWQFEHKGVVRVLSLREEAELALMDVGVEDIKREDLTRHYDGASVAEESSDVMTEIICPIPQLQKVVEVLTSQNIEPESSGLEWVAKETIELSEGDQEKLENLLEALDENDDVQEVFVNV